VPTDVTGKRMKYVLVIPDGVADEPQETLGGQTPLAAASLPGMDEVVRRGCIGRTDNVPESMPSGSDVGTMSLFGYDPLECHTGRAPLEAAASGIELAADDWAIRCNLVTVIDGVMKSFTAGQIPTEDARELIQLLQKDQCGDSHWKFHAGVSYRNLLVYRGRGDAPPFSSETVTVPPHDITDQSVERFLPRGPGCERLTELMDRSRSLFGSAECTRRRHENDEWPATQVWLWGQGKRPALKAFSDRFGVRGAVITAVDLLRGIGRLIGWEVVEVEGATGYLDTDYAAKGRAAIEVLGRSDVDLVVVHVEATDEASHEGDVAAKVEAVQNIDRHIVRSVHDWLQAHGEYRLLVCPDHPTFLRTRTHSHGYCPFAICGTGIEQDSAADYTEGTAARSDLVFDRGCELMPFFTRSPG